MLSRTRFLSRLFGLYCLSASLAMFAHKQAFLDVEITLVHSPALLFIVGIMTLVAGLAMVLGHNIWSGGAMPVVVTVLGWITLVKGLLLLFLSPDAAVAFWGSLHYEQLFYLYASISLAFGAYLTIEGFRHHRIAPDFRERRGLAA